jgi:hypothetical protein
LHSEQLTEPLTFIFFCSHAKEGRRRVVDLK